uniref:Uncharacterized protein n=1 Tax=Cannabis sativa TaxID=3483 RepID=A0A803Q2E9_CANSA
MAEATKVKGLTEEGRYMTILGGILPLSNIWKDIRRISTNNMKEFLDRGNDFIKLEEAIHQAQAGHINNRQSQDTQQPQDSPGAQAGNNNVAHTSSCKHTRNKCKEEQWQKKGSLILLPCPRRPRRRSMLASTS